MDIAKTLYDNGSVWVVKTSCFTGTDKLNPNDLDKDPDEILDIFKLGRKYILPETVRLKAGSAPAKVNALMSAVGRPFFIKGATFVPFKNTIVAKEGLEKIREEHLNIGRDIADNLDNLRRDMIRKYPVLRDAKWPTEEDVMKKFDVSWLVFEINDVGARESDPIELIEAKQKFKEDLMKSYEEFKEETLKELHIALIEACDTIHQKIFESGEKITKATINKPLSIIEKYTTVAEVFDLDDVKAKIKEIRFTLEKYDPKDIRENWNVAQEIGEGLKKMADDLDDLNGYSADGSVKRKIKFKKAA